MAYIFVREPLARQEADRLVNACHSFREKLIIWTLLDTDLRVSEFCGLRLENIQWQQDRIVVHGKGGPYGRKAKRRIVPLTPRAKKLLELQFSTSDAMRLRVTTVQRVVQGVANRAMINKPVSPHVLRHTFAVNCVQQGLSGCYQPGT